MRLGALNLIPFRFFVNSILWYFCSNDITDKQVWWVAFEIGQSLIEAGETYKHLAEIKYNLEDNVKQNFIEPLTQLQNKDLKEVNVS